MYTSCNLLAKSSFDWKTMQFDNKENRKEVFHSDFNLLFFPENKRKRRIVSTFPMPKTLFQYVVVGV